MVEATENVILVFRVIASTSNEVVRPPGLSERCQRRPANRATSEGSWLIQDVRWPPFDCLIAAPDEPPSRSPLRTVSRELATTPEVLCLESVQDGSHCSELTTECSVSTCWRTRAQASPVQFRADGLPPASQENRTEWIACIGRQS